MGADVELLVEMDRANEDAYGVAAKLFGQVTGFAPVRPFAGEISPDTVVWQ